MSSSSSFHCYSSSSASSLSSPENITDEDEFLDNLIENIDLFYTETTRFVENEEQNTAPQKKRRKRRRLDCDGAVKVTKSHSKYVPVLLHRILNADIRKKFSFMFANVINSYDSHLLHAFFDKFTTSDVNYTKILNSSTINIVGNDLLSHYFIATLLLSPDKVIRLTDTNIIQRSDSREVELISEFELNFTKLYNYTPLTLIDSIKKLHELSLIPPIVTRENLSRTVSTTVMTLRDSFTSDQPPPHAWQLLFPRAESPSAMCVTGKITFTLNENRKINKILWDCVECKEL